MFLRSLLVSLFSLALLAGCTWVKVSDEGSTVAVVESADAACKKLGTTTSIGRSELASIDRNEAKVATELETLARNHAATMGANSIVAAGPVTSDGQRTYDVYRCP